MIASPPPQERNKSINNPLIYFTTLSSDLIAQPFVSCLGGACGWRRRSCSDAVEGKEHQVSSSLRCTSDYCFPCCCFVSVCGSWLEASPCLCSTAAPFLLRQHWWGCGVGGLFTVYPGEKKLISNINARPGALCAIVLLSFQKLVF